MRWSRRGGVKTNESESSETGIHLWIEKDEGGGEESDETAGNVAADG
jgi:hypothetical protein